MAIKCPRCGAEYDVTLFTLDRSIRCDCGANVDLAVGHQQASEDGMPAVSQEARRQCVSSGHFPTVPAREHWGFVWLVLVHIVLGIIGVLAACYACPSFDPRYHPSQLVAGMFIGLVFSQTSLLGIWCGLGRSLWWKRVIGVAVGIGYLGPLLGTGVDELDSAIVILVAVATSFVALPLLIARSLRVALRRDSSLLQQAQRVQFSIRHLLVLMVVVACVISIGRLIRDHLDDGDVFIKLISLALTCAVIGVVPVWLVLTAKLRILYSIGLVMVGACAGYYFAQGYSDGVTLWTSAMATEAVAAVASLLVVQSWGYRLVRLPEVRTKETLPR
jgi:hypothetical protein